MCSVAQGWGWGWGSVDLEVGKGISGLSDLHDPGCSHSPAAKEVPSPLMGKLVPHSREMAPLHHGWLSCLMAAWGKGPRSPDWSHQLLARTMSRSLSWPTPASTQSMAYQRVWRDWFCGTMAGGSPWLGAMAGNPGGVSFSEGPVLIVCQRPEALYQTNNSL